MSLLPFLLITGSGAIAVVAARAQPRVATVLGFVVLGVSVVAAMLIRPGQSIPIGSTGIATTDYLRLFLVLGALTCLLLAVVGEATEGRRDAPAVALGVLASCALALSLPDARVAVLAATAGGAFLALVALAWADASIAPLALDLTSVRFTVLAVAIASIFLASVAALIQDDIEHIVGYAIVGDAGVVLLAVAALDPAAWAPARIWILAFVVARSAFAAWAPAA